MVGVGLNSVCSNRSKINRNLKQKTNWRVCLFGEMSEMPLRKSNGARWSLVQGKPTTGVCHVEQAGASSGNAEVVSRCVSGGRSFVLRVALESLVLGCPLLSLRLV